MIAGFLLLLCTIHACIQTVSDESYGITMLISVQYALMTLCLYGRRYYEFHVWSFRGLYRFVNVQSITEEILPIRMLTIDVHI